MSSPAGSPRSLPTSAAAKRGPITIRSHSPRSGSSAARSAPRTPGRRGDRHAVAEGAGERRPGGQELAPAPGGRVAGRRGVPQGDRLPPGGGIADGSGARSPGTARSVTSTTPPADGLGEGGRPAGPVELGDPPRPVGGPEQGRGDSRAEPIGLLAR